MKKSGVSSFGSSKKKYNKSEVFWCYLMLALPIIGFVFLQLYPILWTFKWSLFSYYGIAKNAIFIGLDNFKTFFTSDFTYWKAWGNTLLFAVMKMPIELSLAMILALILDKKMKGSGLFQALYYLPNIISVAIVGLILSNMFSYNGIINGLLTRFGLISENIDWFAQKSSAMWMIVAGSIWSTFGVNVMYLLAALSTVPNEIYESAELDGASAVRKFFSITLPMIAPVFQTILLLSLLGSLSINEYVIVLTNGGPQGQTNTVMSYLYTKFVPGFADTVSPQLGYGCAMSLVTTVIFTVIALAYNKLSNKMNNLY